MAHHRFLRHYYPEKGLQKACCPSHQTSYPQTKSFLRLNPRLHHSDQQKVRWSRRHHHQKTLLKRGYRWKNHLLKPLRYSQTYLLPHLHLLLLCTLFPH